MNNKSEKDSWKSVKGQEHHGGHGEERGVGRWFKGKGSPKRKKTGE